jgi:hypothetical protein
MAEKALSIRAVSAFWTIARSSKGNYSELGAGSGNCGGLREGWDREK